jgi:hypothetical protein
VKKQQHSSQLRLAVFGALSAAAAFNAQALTIDVLEGAEDPISTLIPALGNSGITVVSGSESYVGLIGDGVDPNTAQSATYSGLNLVPNSLGLPTISQDDGIFLTSGVANIPQTNTDSSFDNNSVGTSFPGTGGDADLSQTLTDAGAPSSTVNDVNYIEFDFTLDDPDNNNAISIDFVFGSDEFPDQGVTDVFGFFVDGVNYAFFPDGSLVSFVTGLNAGNFNDNDVDTGNYNLEYDGISNSLTAFGLLDMDLTTHSVKIAIGDTADSIFDSGAFISNLQATFSEGGGITPPSEVPLPGTLALLGLGLLGLGLHSRSRRVV